MLVTNDEKTFERVKILNDHGRDPKDNKTFWMKNALLSASDDKKIIGWSIEEN